MKSLINKLLFLFTICTIFLVTFGVSYSWFTSKNSTVNNLNTANLKTEINEDYFPTKMLLPDKVYKKSIKIINTGNCNAFVRVSLAEILIDFEVEDANLANSGNLKTTNFPSATVIDLNNPLSYENAVPGNLILNKNSLYNTIKNVFKSNITMIYEDAMRNPNISNKIQLVWDTSVGFDWVYENGYFYYTKILSKNMQTPPLLSGIKLKSLNNLEKGSIYKLIVSHESLTTSEDALIGFTDGGWGLNESTSSVLPTLKALISY